MIIVGIIKLERSRRTAAIVAVRAPAVHGVSSKPQELILKPGVVPETEV